MTWNACGELRVVTANPEEMSSKYSPYGLPCFLASSINCLRNSLSGSVLVEVTIRLPCRPVGTRPVCARP